MRECLYESQYFKGEEYLFSGIGFAGFHGLYTSFKPSQFSISYNVRSLDSKRGFLKNLLVAFDGYKKWSNLILDVNLKCKTYDEAKEFLLNTKAVNPCYLSLCGITEGIKIVRG